MRLATSANLQNIQAPANGNPNDTAPYPQGRAPTMGQTLANFAISLTSGAHLKQAVHPRGARRVSAVVLYLLQ